MGIRDDFSQYWDGNGLLVSNPGNWNSGQSGSGNGVLYTSEFYAMLLKNGQLTDQDKLDYFQKISQCVNSAGMLCRVPVSQNNALEAPDDYFGVLNGCKLLNNTIIPRQFLVAVIKNFGALNNISPGTWSWTSFLIRQPQLLAVIVAASFPSWKNPIHFLARLISFPLFLYSAVIIATACMFAEPTDTDSRRLSWHLQSCTKSVSLLCYLASKIWMWRLFKSFPNGMKDIASLYYNPQSNNPYSKWWIT